MSVCKIIRQSRTTAPDLAAAEAKARRRLESEGWRVVRMRIWACPVQPWKGLVWAEFRAVVEEVSTK